MRVRTQLKDIASFSKGAQINGDELVENGKYDYLNGGITPSGKWNEYNTPGGTVTISEGGNSCGYVNYMRNPFWCGAHCYYLFDTISDTEYLYYMLKSQQDRLMKIRTGACMPNIKKADLGSFELEYDTDVEKQQLVVSTLKRVEAIITARHSQLSALDDLIKARFVEMFGDPMPAWPLVTIGDICADTRTGPFGSALHHDEFVNEGIFVLGIDNAVENKFSYSRMRYITEVKYQQLKRYTVHPGDVIITIMGTIGRSAVIPEDMPLAINTKHLACLTPDYSKASSVFLCSAFQMHPEVQRQLTGNAKGAIMDGLNLGIIKSLRFRLPPMQAQKDFELFYAHIDKSKSVIKKSLEGTQILFDSLMQKYFG